MSRFQRLSWCLLGGFLTACSSPGAAPDGGAALLVTLHDFRSGKRFELASESHTNRVEYYSDQRSDAARKVLPDQAMVAFVEELDHQGFGKHARTGHAPAVAQGDMIRWGLEVESRSGQTHWLVGTGSPPADWQEFQK